MGLSLFMCTHQTGALRWATGYFFSLMQSTRPHSQSRSGALRVNHADEQVQHEGGKSRQSSPPVPFCCYEQGCSV